MAFLALKLQFFICYPNIEFEKKHEIKVKYQGYAISMELFANFGSCAEKIIN